MPSTFSWMDHSDAEQRRVLEAIDRFREREARDELGLASVRDAFANSFFPGTSTIQTRARYFLFVPWVYLELERKKTSAADIAAAARRAETSVAAALKAANEDETGIIGGRAGDSVKRLPSSVYWLGLSIWGIRIFDGPIAAYHRGFDRFQLRRVARDDDDQPLDASGRNWHGALPPMPRGFPKETSFALTQHEAEYLKDRIQTAPATRGSLLATLVRSPERTAHDFIWEHPDLSAWPEAMRQEVEHARLFSGLVHGAALLYNLLLSEARAATGSEDAKAWGESYREQLASWAVSMTPDRTPLAQWNREAFWRLVGAKASQVPVATKAFVERWFALAPWERADGGADLTPARELITERERHLKGQRARLANPRALELWQGASGLLRLDFRWNATQRLLKDIYAGLDQKGGADARAA